MRSSATTISGGPPSGQHQTEHGIQLVDCPEGLDARIVLADAASIAKTRLASVAATGVDTRGTHGLIALVCHR